MRKETYAAGWNSNKLSEIQLQISLDLLLVEYSIQQDFSDLCCLQAGALHHIGNVFTISHAALGGAILLQLTSQAEGCPAGSIID